MQHTRSLAFRALAAVALTLAAGFALAGTASAAPAAQPAKPAPGIVCPIYAAGTDAAIIRPCFPPCPIYADAAPADQALIIRPCPPCPVYYLSGAIRACPPPCPIYLTGDAPATGLRVWCPPPPPCPHAADLATDQLIYCPLPES
jgi:hypothetical protein